MNLLRWRRPDYRSAITAFWAWWPHHSDELAALAQSSDGLGKKLRRTFAAKVADIHPELTWEFIDGTLARHALVLTSEGSADLRVLTERWRRAGPGDDEHWEFYASRPPNPQAMHSTVTVGRRELKPLAARFGTEVDHARARVHVSIWHPDLGYLEEAERLWLAFLLLDWVLGEDDVERWIGEVRFSGTPHEHDGPGLRRVIVELSREIGTGGWAHLEGIDHAGRPLSVEVRIPSPRFRYPLFDAHGALHIPLLQTPPAPEDEIVALAVDPPTPDEGELAEVSELAASLMALLGDAAVLAAVETMPDRRTLHIYTDSESVVPDQVRTFIAGQGERFPQRPLSVEWTADPGWEKIRHFT